MSDHGVYRNSGGAYVGRDYEPTGKERSGWLLYETRFVQHSLHGLPTSEYSSSTWSEESSITFLFPWEFLE